jgi:hypothetical protein
VSGSCGQPARHTRREGAACAWLRAPTGPLSQGFDRVALYSTPKVSGRKTSRQFQPIVSGAGRTKAFKEFWHDVKAERRQLLRLHCSARIIYMLRSEQPRGSGMTSRGDIWRLAGAAALAAIALTVQASVAEDLVPTETRFGFENNSSPGIPNCTVAAYISNFPAPEFVNLRFRVDADLQKNVMFFSITTDVGELVYQNGKPSGTRAVAIDQAEFLARDFDSQGRTHVTLDDGGVQLSTNDAQVFPILILTFQSGQFTIRFRRQGTDAIRGYSISASPSIVMEPSRRFRNCMTAMLAVVNAK